MKKCAIIIGVNKVDRMPLLSAAVDGARKFKIWADSQKFETFLITDEHEPVSRSTIFKCVREQVNKGSYRQMIIFFSGHGIWKSVNDEKWLLSGVAEDSMEAVNVQASASMAGSSGIPHIVFISDACRTGTIDPIISQVTGSPIFPPGVNFSRHSLDLFFSTKALDPAFELRARSEVPESYGVYTKHLLKGLNGEVSKIITTVNLDGIDTSVVQSFELQGYLETAVQEEIEGVDRALVQQPQGSITSRSPHFLSLINSDRQGMGDRPPGDGEVLSNYRSRDDDDDVRKQYGNLGQVQSDQLWSLSEDMLRFVVDSLRLKADISSSVFQHLRLKASGPDYWYYRNHDGRNGFFLAGDDESARMILSLNLPNKKIQDIDEDWSPFLSFFVKTESNYLLLRTGEDNFVPLTILPGFLCIVTCSRGKITNINYQPSSRNPRYQDFIDRSLEVEIRRAVVYAETKNGSFTMNGRNSEFIRYANYLRNEKAYDPTLGMYAAYGYAQAGVWQEVRSIYEYMRMEREEVLFDVRMLTAVSPFRFDMDTETQLNGNGPLLTQGWSYMSIKPEIFPKYLYELAKHLVPGLWTTFTGQGAKIFEENIIR